VLERGHLGRDNSSTCTIQNQWHIIGWFKKITTWERTFVSLKEMNLGGNPSRTILSCTDDDKDETLASMFVKHRGHPPQHSMKSSSQTSQFLNAMQLVIHGVPKAGILEVEDSIKARKKIIMQPFATSPTKRPNVGRTPLDTCQLYSEKKMKTIPSFKKGIGKSILKAKREKKIGRSMRSLTCTQVQGVKIVQSLSNDMEDTSGNEDNKWGTKCDNSGAEVKGDSDYKP